MSEDEKACLLSVAWSPIKVQVKPVEYMTDNLINTP
jgi:hypothetical protein